MNTTFKKSFTHLSQSLPPPNPQSRILTLCNLGRLQESLHLLLSHPHPLPLPTSTYSSLLHLCITSNASVEGRSLHNHLLSNRYPPDPHLTTKFIIFYTKLGDVAAARELFDEMPHRTIVSWTAMISGYSRNGYAAEALEVFALMRRAGVRGNQYTYGSVLTACARKGCVRSGGQIHACILKGRFAGHMVVESALVDLYFKCGEVESARGLFGRMERRDVVSWNSVIGGHAVRGRGGEAIGLFCEMLRDGHVAWSEIS